MRITRRLSALITLCLASLLGPIALAQAGGAAPDTSGEVLFASTLWMEHAEESSGAYSIVRRDDGGVWLRLGGDFRMKKAVGLVVVLSPQQPADLTKGTVMTDSLALGALVVDTGEQEYRLPDGADPARYRSLAIVRGKDSKVWSASALSEGEVVDSGSVWVKKTKKSSGGYEIVRRADGYFLRFGPDFKTASPPEPLRILLSTTAPDTASNQNAEQGAVFVAELAKIKGGQEYRLPDGVDLDAPRSLLLNCVKYTKLWSAAPLGLARH